MELSIPSSYSFFMKDVLMQWAQQGRFHSSLTPDKDWQRSSCPMAERRVQCAAVGHFLVFTVSAMVLQPSCVSSNDQQECGLWDWRDLLSRPASEAVCLEKSLQFIHAAGFLSGCMEDHGNIFQVTVVRTEHMKSHEELHMMWNTQYMQYTTTRHPIYCDPECRDKTF